MPKTRHAIPDPHAYFWRLPAVITFTGRSRSRIYGDKTFPRPRRIGPNTSAWVASEVREWAAACDAGRAAA